MTEKPPGEILNQTDQLIRDKFGDKVLEETDTLLKKEGLAKYTQREVKEKVGQMASEESKTEPAETKEKIEKLKNDLEKIMAPSAPRGIEKNVGQTGSEKTVTDLENVMKAPAEPFKPSLPGTEVPPAVEPVPYEILKGIEPERTPEQKLADNEIANRLRAKQGERGTIIEITPEYFKEIKNWEGLYVRMREAGMKEQNAEALKNFRTEFSKYHTDDRIKEDSPLLYAFTSAGGFRVKIHELLMKDIEERTEKSPDPIPSGTAESVAVSERPEPDPGDIIVEQESKYESGADSSDDVEFQDIAGIVIDGIGSAKNFDNLYVLIRRAKNISSVSGKQYTAEEIIKRIETVRTLSKDKGNVDWLGVGDVTGGPDKGGADDIRKKVLEFLRNEIDSPKIEGEGEVPEIADVDSQTLKTPSVGENQGVAEKKLEREASREDTNTEGVDGRKLGESKTENTIEKRKSDWARFAGVRAGVLSEYAIEALGNLYESSRFANMIDRTSALFNDRLARWHEGGAIKLKSKMERQLKKADDLKVALKYVEGSWKRSYLEGLIEYRLGLVEGNQKNVGYREKLEKRNARRAEFEDKRNTLCGQVVERLNKRLEPYDEKIEALKMDKKELEGIANEVKAKITERQNERKELDGVRASLPFLARMSVKLRIREMDADIKKWEKAMGKMRQSQSKLDIKIAKADAKAKPLRDSKTEIEGILKRRQDITKGLESTDRNAEELKKKHKEWIKQQGVKKTKK